MAGKGVDKGRGKGREHDTATSAYSVSSRNDSAGSVGLATVAPEQTAESRRAKGSKVLTHEQIAERAEAIWMERGCRPDEDEKNWYEAESQLKHELGIE